MLEWSEFAQRLARELAGLDRDTILIVREREENRHYVQAMREPDRLYAEAVSNNFLDGPLLLTPADEEVMSEAGWQPPAEPSPRNWWTELPGYATASDHFRLADMMVTALRDVQGVRRPSDLVHESFHRLGSGLIELTGLGLAPADPARVTERREPAPAVAVEPDPLLSAPVPVTDPTPNGMAHVPPGDGELEERLADAKQRGDHVTYFDLLLRAELALPAPTTDDFPTVVIAGVTYVMAFTSSRAMGQSVGSQTAHRWTSFGALAAAWPDPAWSLVINPGLPSEIHLDAPAIARLDSTRRAAEQAAAAQQPEPDVTTVDQIPAYSPEAPNPTDPLRALDTTGPHQPVRTEDPVRGIEALQSIAEATKPGAEVPLPSQTGTDAPAPSDPARIAAGGSELGPDIQQPLGVSGPYPTDAASQSGMNGAAPHAGTASPPDARHQDPANGVVDVRLPVGPARAEPARTEPGSEPHQPVHPLGNAASPSRSEGWNATDPARSSLNGTPGSDLHPAGTPADPARAAAAVAGAPREPARTAAEAAGNAISPGDSPRPTGATRAEPVQPPAGSGHSGEEHPRDGHHARGGDHARDRGAAESAPVPGPRTPDPHGAARASGAGTPHTPMRMPHGVQLWRAEEDGADAAPVAVYDAISGAWTRILTDAREGVEPPVR